MRGYQSWMEPNRIREWRERRNMSQAQLATAVGTTQPTIDRLEKGVRKLTVEWMRRISKALSIEPADLITAAVAAGLSEEAEAYVSNDPQVNAVALERRGLAYFKIKSNTVERAGVTAGTVILIDMTPAAVENIRSGDIVVAQVYDSKELLKASTIVRQFVAPQLLTTNRHGANTVFSMDDAGFVVAIKGVRVPE